MAPFDNDGAIFYGVSITLGRDACMGHKWVITKKKVCILRAVELFIDT
jgi:hypothetical protein